MASFSISVPSVKILGDKEVHVKSGTSVTLRCLISNVLDVPSYVFWYRGDRRILAEDDGGDGDDNSTCTIDTRRVVGDGSAVSTLTIDEPSPRHSGIYSCRPANLEKASVSLHVIQGKIFLNNISSFR